MTQESSLSIASLEELGRRDPVELLRLVETGNLPTHVLTFAAEIAGHLCPREQVVPVLLKLLNHPDAYVREGACLGLYPHVEDLAVIGRLRVLAFKDLSHAIREVAAAPLAGMPLSTATAYRVNTATAVNRGSWEWLMRWTGWAQPVSSPSPGLPLSVPQARKHCGTCGTKFVQGHQKCSSCGARRDGSTRKKRNGGR